MCCALPSACILPWHIWLTNTVDDGCGFGSNDQQLYKLQPFLNNPFRTKQRQETHNIYLPLLPHLVTWFAQSCYWQRASNHYCSRNHEEGFPNIQLSLSFSIFHSRVFVAVLREVDFFLCSSFLSFSQTPPPHPHPSVQALLYLLLLEVAVWLSLFSDLLKV